MDASLHTIEGRSRENEVIPATFEQFQLGAAEPVSSRIVVESRGWVPYCLNCETRTALFLETAPEVDLSRGAFVNPVLFREARRAVVVPFAALEDLADAIVPPSRLIFIFNIGRCGTTLVNAMLNEIDGVWSLSEPDVYFDMVMRHGLLDPAEVPGLVRSCTRLLFRPPAGRGAHTLAIKFRPDALHRAERFHAVFPDAACVFMYRDGVSWARSFCHFMRNLGVPPVLDRETRQFVWWIMSGAADVGKLDPYVDMDAEEVHPEELLAPVWAFHLEEYLRQLAKGVPFLAIRYNELDADRQAVAARLLRHCRLSAGALPLALGAFQRDSQEGTAIARGRRKASFSEENAARFLATLARHPWIKSPDLVVPDIYSD